MDYRGEVMLKFQAIPIGVEYYDNLGDLIDEAEGMGDIIGDTDNIEFSDDPIAILEYPEFPYSLGERCAQMWLEKVEEIEFEEVIELSDTERGTGGFGHTGNK